MREAPAVRIDRGLQDRWPDGAREVVAAGADGERDAAPLVEPVGDVGQERREHRGGAAKTYQEAVRDGELHDALGIACRDVAETERDRTADHRDHDAM